MVTVASAGEAPRVPYISYNTSCFHIQYNCRGIEDTITRECSVMPLYYIPGPRLL